MPRLKFIEANGIEHEVDAREGQSVMQAATSNLVPGIIAECGGLANCATCHVYIDEAFRSKVPPPEQNEKEMLGCATHVKANSRLSCQIKMTQKLDGLVVHLPVSQTCG